MNTGLMIISAISKGKLRKRICGRWAGEIKYATYEIRIYNDRGDEFFIPIILGDHYKTALNCITKIIETEKSHAK